MTINERILVVDDELDMAESTAYLLQRAGYEAKFATSGDAALEQLDSNPFSLVVTDLKMPRMTGLALLDAVKSRDPDIEVVVITGYPEIDTAVQAIKRGAWDYITKPFTEKDLLERVDKAMAHRRLKEENEALRERLRHGGEGLRLIYRSEVFAQTVEVVEKAARSDASVLILGESGTGKELLAHRLHAASPRCHRPFVPVDCTTIPESLVESELFGHVKGAFTGADRNKIGLFRVADKGTLFLDEVGELPLSFQPKLLRAIQERRVRPVGATETVPVDVRIVCATNRHLAEEVEAGRFRQDLFYRIDVVRILAPPLRERPQDIAPMAEHWIAQFAALHETVVRGVSPEALSVLKAFHWPGNVRQLRNVIERACTLGENEELQVADLPPELRDHGAEVAAGDLGGTFQEMKARKVAAIESTYVTELLKKHHGNVTHAAEDAGMARSAFQKLMQRYEIRSREYRG